VGGGEVVLAWLSALARGLGEFQAEIKPSLLKDNKNN
jgi:hypothetical protein